MLVSQNLLFGNWIYLNLRNKTLKIIAGVMGSESSNSQIFHSMPGTTGAGGNVATIAYAPSQHPQGSTVRTGYWMMVDAPCIINQS